MGFSEFALMLVLNLGNWMWISVYFIVILDLQVEGCLGFNHLKYLGVLIWVMRVSLIGLSILLGSYFIEGELFVCRW